MATDLSKSDEVVGELSNFLERMVLASDKEKSQLLTEILPVLSLVGENPHLQVQNHQRSCQKRKSFIILFPFHSALWRNPTWTLCLLASRALIGRRWTPPVMCFTNLATYWKMKEQSLKSKLGMYPPHTCHFTLSQYRYEEWFKIGLEHPYKNVRLAHVKLIQKLIQHSKGLEAFVSRPG